MCAAVDVDPEGPCKGDSGGPVMYKNNELKKYIQIAIVKGSLGECGDKDFPAIFARLDHPSIWNFIAAIIQKGTATNILFKIILYLFSILIWVVRDYQKVENPCFILL
jgi:secreted trypsin-like serine protease